METTEVYRSRYQCLATGKEFNKAGFGRDLSQEYGQKYYITEDGEAAIVDLIGAKPLGMVDLDHYVELLWVECGMNKIFAGSSDVRQAAWRFFADLSRNEKLWYFERMKGHIVCGKFIMHKPGEIGNQLYINAHRIGKEEKLLSVLQPITFEKWLNLPETSKRSWVQQFLSSPQYYDVRTLSDPIYPHPFHPELSI